jgi:hypothetical protein
MRAELHLVYGILTESFYLELGKIYVTAVKLLAIMMLDILNLRVKSGDQFAPF